jgi:hypothetical protein
MSYAGFESPVSVRAQGVGGDAVGHLAEHECFLRTTGNRGTGEQGNRGTGEHKKHLKKHNLERIRHRKH